MSAYDDPRLAEMMANAEEAIILAEKAKAEYTAGVGKVRERYEQMICDLIIERQRWRRAGVWIPAGMMLAFALFCLLYLGWWVVPIPCACLAGLYVLTLAEM